VDEDEVAASQVCPLVELFAVAEELLDLRLDGRVRVGEPRESLSEGLLRGTPAVAGCGPVLGLVVRVEGDRGDPRRLGRVAGEEIGRSAGSGAELEDPLRVLREDGEDPRLPVRRSGGNPVSASDEV